MRRSRITAGSTSPIGPAERVAVARRLDLQRHHRVLERCGTGCFTDSLSDQCARWVAIDFSLRSLSPLRRTLGGRKSLHLVRVDVNYVPLAPDERFDRIVSTQMFAQLPPRCSSAGSCWTNASGY